MKRFAAITACIVVLCAAMFYLISMPHNMSGVTAKGGVIDLTGADFTDTIYTLDGEWEFYCGELYTPKDFANGTPEGGDIIAVPASWDEAGYSLFGCATYRLTVYADEANTMMLIPEIMDSSIVWINGEKVFEAGVLGKTKEESTTSIRNAFINVRFENGQAEIVVQAANYNWSSSGLFYRATLGRDGLIMGGAITRRLLLAFVIGILIAMSMYHAILFVYHRGEKVYLAFSLVCLFASLRFLLETNSFADLFLRGGIGVLLTRALLLLFVLHMGAVLFFAYKALSMKIKGKFQRYVYAAIFAVTSIGAIFDLHWGLIALILIPLVWTIVDGVRSGRARENPYYALFLFALALGVTMYPISIFFLNDSLFVPGIAPNLFLPLSQCVMLAVSYAETKRRETELAAKTDFYHQMAHDLLTPLTIISTSIQVAAVRPEKASEKLKDSQAEIMKMAGMINAALQVCK